MNLMTTLANRPEADSGRITRRTSPNRVLVHDQYGGVGKIKLESRQPRQLELWAEVPEGRQSPREKLRRSIKGNLEPWSQYHSVHKL